MIDISEMAFHGAAWVCIAALKAAPIFLVVFLLAGLIHKLLPARVVCILWMFVVVRLLLPVSIASPIAISPSVDALMDTFGIYRFESPPADIEPFVFHDRNGTPALAGQPVHPADISLAEFLQPGTTQTAVSPYNVANAQAGVSVLDMAIAGAGFALAWTWIAGVTFFMCRGTIAYFRFSRRLHKLDIIEDQLIVDRVLRACDRVGVGRRPRVKEVESLDAPAVFGLFRPVVCLPADWREQLSDERLDWVLRHELAHVRRRDGIVLFVAGVARSGCSRAGSSLARSVQGELVLEKSGVRLPKRAFGFATKHLIRIGRND